ncbi:hypothetical protein [uncultured Jatrophihabitans sp.]|uniref:hypothetical protein n=1 Tax=uncultured Jatrophihabitans sp. TaxID=1610747 RepID=UPI0035CA8D3B
MTTSNALRPSSYRCVFTGLGMELGSFVVTTLGSSSGAGWMERVSAALGICGVFVLVVGACKIVYDVLQLARGRSPREAVRRRVGPKQMRLSTVTNLTLGVAMVGTYFWLCARHVASFGAAADIGGGGLLVGGGIVATIGVAKLVFDLVWRRDRV